MSFGIIMVLLLISLLGFYFLWKRTEWSKPLKIGISALWGVFLLIVLIAPPKSNDSLIDHASEIKSGSSSMESSSSVSKSSSFRIESSSSTSESSSSAVQSAPAKSSSSSQGTLSPGHIDAEPPQISSEAPAEQQQQEVLVWVPRTGKKYHRNPACSNMKNPSQIPLSEAQARGFTPCKNCY